jgi:hypothetical protein
MNSEFRRGPVAATVGPQGRRRAAAIGGSSWARSSSSPALGGLGAVFGFVGARRSSLRGLGWVVFVVGLLLVLATIAAIVWLMLVLRSFESG